MPNLKLSTVIRAGRLVLLPCLFFGLHASALELESPDGKMALSFDVKNFDGLDGCPVYRVSWAGQELLTDSRMGLDSEGTPLNQDFKVTGEKRSSEDRSWKTVWGERAEVRDHYNQVVVTLERTKSPKRMLEITFRAYNEGLAYCYTVPKRPGFNEITILGEQSEFRFAGDYKAWTARNAQSFYKAMPVSRINFVCERPMALEAPGGLSLAIGEARSVDYARMKFGPLKGAPHSLVGRLTGKVSSALPLTTPWRFIMAADSPGKLLENNFLLLNLNDPCALQDTSWIKPGKVLREVTLTTTGGKACVDFAAERKLEYILFDAGWYGAEKSPKSDASTVTIDPARSTGPLDLPEIIRYAKERGVGVILYVNQVALSKQLDEILPLFRKWGVKGVKYGFVNVGSQAHTAWLHEAVRKAAENQLMVDIHDEYRPTGYQRTYPNLMTAEGIAGDETSPANQSSLAHLFNRLLAGPADHTFCYYVPRVQKNASCAYQLAKSVCIFSPWQFLFWYDRPAGSPVKAGGAGDGEETFIGDEPELEFFEALPTTWDETRVIHGKIGEYAVIARRHGKEWFIGAMNSTVERTLEVPLDFLSADGKCQATIYSDDPSVKTRTMVRVDKQAVDHSTVLKVTMSAQGGQAIRIAPAE